MAEKRPVLRGWQGSRRRKRRKMMGISMMECRMRRVERWIKRRRRRIWRKGNRCRKLPLLGGSQKEVRIDPC